MIVEGIDISRGFTFKAQFRAPDAPTIGTATTLSNTTANITFTAPTFIGDSPLIGYTAIAYPGGVRTEILDPNTSNITLAGLTPGTRYTVSVTANNSEAPSANSASTNLITTFDVPGIPTGQLFKLSSTTANVYYTLSPDTGNTALFAVVAQSNTGIVLGKIHSVTGGSAGNLTLTGLSANTSYNIQLAANNISGLGSLLSFAPIYTSVFPDAPAISYVVATSDTTANIVFTAPEYVGSGITSYTGNASGISYATVSQAGSGNITLTGLSSNITYLFNAVATNSQGNSIPSSSVTASTWGATVTPAASSINEGSTLTINVATTNIPDGTTLYWITNNITTSNVDFVSNVVSGSFIVTANTGSFTVSSAADSGAAEGAETFSVSIKSSNTSGTVMATSSVITISDTSFATASFSSVPGSINEGSPGTFNVSTSGIADATTLYWTVETNAGDFATSSGSFVITSNAGSFNVTPTADVTTEGAETFTVSIRTGSITGPVLVTSSSVIINDTSTAVTTFDVQYVIVAGGGGGPSGGNDSGGGGAGGYRTNRPGDLSGQNAAAETAFTVTIGANYPVTIGAGGTNASNGSPSNFSIRTASGGGKGGITPAAGNTGGSGGGGGGSGAGGASSTSGQGFAGGPASTDAGGGGGASQAGFPGSPTASPTSSKGGDGQVSTITGITTRWAGGGGGGNDTSTRGIGGSGGGAPGANSGGGGAGGTGPIATNGENGGVNTGGGGGGTGSVGATGGAGGSGVVILRYPNARTIIIGSGLTAPAPLTNAAAPNNERYTLISGGSGTVSWS